jgi:hypothetical protein
VLLSIISKGIFLFAMLQWRNATIEAKCHWWN